MAIIMILADPMLILIIFVAHLIYNVVIIQCVQDLFAS